VSSSLSIASPMLPSKPPGCSVARFPKATIQLAPWRELDVFRKRYPWVDDDALEFYKLHAGVDVEHGVIRQQILKQYANTKELQEECINAQLMKNNMRRVMADAIYMAYVVQNISLDTSSVAA
jgi:hypothetical protein